MTHTPATVLVVGMILAAGSAHAEEVYAMMRVRSENATIARLITQAAERSATFRREIEAINHTDGIVYVHADRCGSGSLGCLMHSVEIAGPHRVLRVKLDMRRSERDIMATLGHELQHALEVLNEPRVRSNASIQFFYRQLNPNDSHQFETAVAFQAGVEVYRELWSHATQRSGGANKSNAAR